MKQTSAAGERFELRINLNIFKSFTELRTQTMDEAVFATKGYSFVIHINQKL